MDCAPSTMTCFAGGDPTVGPIEARDLSAEWTCSEIEIELAAAQVPPAAFAAQPFLIVAVASAGALQGSLAYAGGPATPVALAAVYPDGRLAGMPVAGPSRGPIRLQLRTPENQEADPTGRWGGTLVARPRGWLPPDARPSRVGV